MAVYGFINQESKGYAGSPRIPVGTSTPAMCCFLSRTTPILSFKARGDAAPTRTTCCLLSQVRIQQHVKTMQPHTESISTQFHSGMGTQTLCIRFFWIPLYLELYQSVWQWLSVSPSHLLVSVPRQLTGPPRRHPSPTEILEKLVRPTIRMSSRYTKHLLRTRLARTVSIGCWKVAGVLRSPKSITLYSYSLMWGESCLLPCVHC